MTEVDIDPTEQGYHPPYLAAILAACGVLVLYVLTLAPTTAFWDTSEYIATAHILGIPHPPGNPLFVVLGKAWSILLAPFGLSIAVRINLLAAFTSALASGFLYLVAHRVLSELFEDRWCAIVGAAASTILGATAFTVWNQSNVNEKVYTISVLVIAWVTWLAILWNDRKDDLGSERYLLGMIFLLSLGSTNHLMSVLPAPAITLLILFTAPTTLLRHSFIIRAVPLILIGLSFNFVLPIRAGLDPVINEGDPTCESVIGAAQAIYSNGMVGCPMLADNLTRRQYQPPPVTQRKAPFRAQFAMYMQYFDWQWARGWDPSPLPGTGRTAFSLIFGLLGLLGLYSIFRVDRSMFTYILTLIVTLSFGLIIYLNFRYGYSLAPEITDRAQHEVRERDYFYVVSFMLWGFLAGIGLSWIWYRFGKVVRNARPYVITAPIMMVALLPLFLNWSWASRAGDYAARDWAYDLLMSVEPYGILFTNGDNDTFPLWYLQEVEGIRSDVTVIVGQYLFTSWYPKQLQELTTPERQRIFDSEISPGLFSAYEKPNETILDLTHEQMDQVGASRLSENLTIPFPSMAVTYPAETVLNRGHQLALSIIHDSIDERPIFFASSGGLMSELGLDRWAVRHGLAVKLEMRSLTASAPEGWVQGTAEFGGVWFDLDQSLRLYDTVYQYRGIKNRSIWQDRSTLNIPWQYYALALQLSDVARNANLPDEVARRLENDAEAFQIVAEGGVNGTPAQ